MGEISFWHSPHCFFDHYEIRQEIKLQTAEIHRKIQRFGNFRSPKYA